MPERIFGIYGFEFSKPFEVGEVQFVPLLAGAECRELATDQETFHLTGYGRIAAGDEDAWSDVERVQLIVSAMTFAQQQHVLSSILVNISPGDSVEEFLDRQGLPETLPVMGARNTSGDIIISDRWRSSSRKAFIDAFVSRFRVEKRPDSLRSAFFRQIEVWRLGTPFVELHHFLVFSGLELLARDLESCKGGNAAIPIAKMLRKFDFEITQRDVERWAAARNAAFHHGELRAIDPQDGSVVSLTDQLYPMTQVLADVCLKLLPYDDGHINWTAGATGCLFLRQWRAS